MYANEGPRSTRVEFFPCPCSTIICIQHVDFSKAVRLPEIVATILNTTDDKKTLVSCIQVSRLWAEEATACLSRSDPPIDALLALNRPDRLQYYTNKIDTLGTFISELFTPCSEYNKICKTHLISKDSACLSTYKSSH